MIKDPICAIATSLGSAALSVIRTSGENCISLVNKIFKGADLNKKKANTISYGHIVYQGETIDEVMVSVFRAPKSFTTEDSVEITCHGGVYVTNRVLEALLNNGFRLANRGEFSLRAFLNGRIDLTKAEAIMDIVGASNASMLKIANNALSDKTHLLIESLKSDLLDIMGHIEVNIDYPEYEDAVLMTNQIVLPLTKALLGRVDKIIENSRISTIVANGINTVIIGKPNVGKSSLLNDLVSDDKAIVTDVPGTTRDLIEASISLGPITLNLIDTAGIRNSNDLVEKIGIDKSYAALNKADLVLLVLDGSNELDELDEQLLLATKEKNRIIVVNKNDLSKAFHLDEAYVSISALNKAGLSELIDEIISVTKISTFQIDDQKYLTNTRHISLMNLVKAALEEAIKSCESGVPVDMIELDLNEAYKNLQMITGEASNEDLLNELFSKFCLGK